MELHVGCAMWTYAPWQGRYLPHPLPPKERLSAYATWCNAVEGNTTFYATPAADTVRSWAGPPPPAFRFRPQAPKAVPPGPPPRRGRRAAPRLPDGDRAARPAGPRAVDPAAAVLQPGRTRHPGDLPAPS